ncbi:MAG TPA: molybdopterin molybdenumtransferase MoeA, partial [Rhodospirillaceae bacterium]|nr:molybdopterin molybdenumtransferase MoeA [Rhodospirillaceae bacterium]
KPLIFGDFNGTPLLGLPGNPVSTMVCALIFLKPALAAQLGLELSEIDDESAILSEPIDANGGREDYIRATLQKSEDGRLLVTPFPVQDSSMMVPLSRSDCFIVRAPNAAGEKVGASVSILKMPAEMGGF